jgi:undecaprenyl pyrophosphate phosphatase UppP
MDYFTIFIYFIALVKFVFICTSLYLRVLERQNKDQSKINKLTTWKESVKFIFDICMGILLILLFSPFTYKIYSSKLFEYETRAVLFLFGIILLIESNWGTILHNKTNK